MACLFQSSGLCELVANKAGEGKSIKDVILLLFVATLSMLSFGKYPSEYD